MCVRNCVLTYLRDKGILMSSFTKSKSVVKRAHSLRLATRIHTTHTYTHIHAHTHTHAHTAHIHICTIILCLWQSFVITCMC